jgi:hypothetical protein
MASGEEVLRGMGIIPSDSSNESGDVKSVEVKGKWEREKTRLGRNLKTLERERGKIPGVDAFGGTAED